ncbi:hypothetical protein MBFIL_15850 [Methanobrevibacter filiformis]|uniref:Uncharacterized protein n=1 Tax=Methanobrevibacter filiformis TaxID=55758 RepID=A0A165ZP36_9EURY|nr:hypothetical protein MBFIL_15850 [Methanobrevibacter filiformis]
MNWIMKFGAIFIVAIMVLSAVAYFVAMVI